MKIMNLSPHGAKLIQTFEQLRLETYLDSAGKPTIGYGHLVLPGEDFSQGITVDKADELFNHDSQSTVTALDGFINTNISQFEFDACCSLAYNIGVHNFATSTLLRLLNAGNIQGASDQFNAWRLAGGKVSAGLIRRRACEKMVFDTGNYDDAIQRYLDGQ